MMRISIFRALIPGVATTILAIALLLVTYESLKSGPTHNPPAAERVMTTAAAQTSPTKIEVELVTLQPHGFEPAELTRPQGRFVLGVDNRSGLEDIQLRLEREDGSRVPVLTARKRRLSANDYESGRKGKSPSGL